LLASLSAVAGVQLLPRTASATLVRGMTLAELVGRSQHAIIGTATDARCLYQNFGSKRMIVTETRMRVEGVLGLTAPAERELSVRTLGGQLDGAGELVHGQAEFGRGKPCVAFFERTPDGLCWVTGMAQGHYPLNQTDSALVLQASPQLPAIVDWEQSAVKRLVGAHLDQAERLIAAVKSR
jgi:hypothetical protein